MLWTGLIYCARSPNIRARSQISCLKEAQESLLGGLAARNVPNSRKSPRCYSRMFDRDRRPKITSSHFHSSSSGYKLISLKQGHLPQQTGNVTQQPYIPPAKGMLSKLPPSLVPYAELIRLEKPTGTYYLFFPCLFSTLLAAPLTTPMASPLSVLSTSLLFFAGALIMRGAGCTINDIWDRNLDPHVARTRLRPIARGAIPTFDALTFAGVQLLVGLGILVQFPFECLYYGIPSLLLVASYPLAKRVTHYPQFVLGLTFSWGAIMGFPALGIDLISNTAGLMAATCLYTSNVAWTVLYDMVYAHMDIRDDAKAGIKSIALRHDAQTKKVLGGLAITQVLLLSTAGVVVGAGPVYFVGTCGGAAVTLAIMIARVNLKCVRNCWWWFVNGCWLTGGVIAAGMGAEYGLKYIESDGRAIAMLDSA